MTDAFESDAFEPDAFETELGDVTGESASFDVDISFTAEAFSANVPAGNFPVSLDFSASPKSTIPASADFDLPNIGFDAEPVSYLAFGTRLSVFLRILPAQIQPFRKKQSFRFLANGTPVHFSDVDYVVDTNGVGFELTLTLADMSQRDLITEASECLFEVFSGGAWKTVMQAGKIASRLFSISWADNSPGDSCQVTIRDNRLELAPTRPLVLYDPSRVSIEESDFEILEDTEGIKYYPEVEAIAGLSLRKIFDRIFVEECGFSKVVTNILDYNVRRIDFPLTETYFDAISGLMGVYEPLPFIVGTELWIQSADFELSPGMPRPEVLTIRDYRDLEVEENVLRADALLVDYQANENEFDEINFRTEQSFSSAGDSSEYTTTEVETIIRDYKFRGRVMRSDIRFVNTITRGYHPSSNLFQKISEITETKTYNSQGRERLSIKVEKALVPVYENSGWTWDFSTILTETHETLYGAHPYRPSETIQKGYNFYSTGLIYEDPDNPSADVPFAMSFKDAYRSGNLSETAIIRTGRIKTSREWLEPRNGQVRIKGETIDHIRNVTINAYDEVRPGDNGFPTISTVSRPILVFPETGGALTGKPVVDLSVGELPLTYALPLARRRLRRLRDRPRTFSLAIYGWIDNLRRGAIYVLKDRQGTDLGTMLVEGYSVSGKSLGTAEREIVTVLRGREIGAGSEGEVVHSTSTQVQGGTVQYLDVYFDADPSKTLRCDPVAGVTIEGKIFGAPDSAYADLETTGLPLAAMIDSPVKIRVRITAEATSSALDRQFDFHLT